MVMTRSGRYMTICSGVPVVESRSTIDNAAFRARLRLSHRPVALVASRTVIKTGGSPLVSSPMVVQMNAHEWISAESWAMDASMSMLLASHRSEMPKSCTD